jgi:dethiobiotin synthetase
MGKGIFITGTDTGVGKTFFTASLARYLHSCGFRVGVMKPAESGCRETDGKFIPEDALALKAASGSGDSIETICPYRLPEPLAPSLAAERAGVKIDVDHLRAVYEDIQARNDLTLVEGAGGLMVPLLPTYTYADFAGSLKLPLLVVGANRLGVINHLLLTLEQASCKGSSVLGYVLNHLTSESSLAAATNREVLSGLTAVPCLGELPFVEGKFAPADLIESELNLRLLESVLPRR